MIIRSVLTAMVLGLATLALAGPPGILDGENIPADFTGNLVATQRNSSQFGDYFVTPGAWVAGSETDQLFVAKSVDKLHIGITGNLETNGHAWLIGINVPNRTGQTANRSEGASFCPDPNDFDPPWTLQESGLEVIIDDAGTPGDTSDDTWSYGVGGTMTFPCETDYVFAVDIFSGTIHLHQYTLYDPAGAPFGTWDPTPGNLADPLADLFAEKMFVADGPIDDGDDLLFEQNLSGFTEGGFDNTNEAGVTDTDGSGANTANRGFELAIPFAALQTDSGPLTGSDIIDVYVLLADGSESSCVGENYGNIINQVLPPLAAGSVCDLTDSDPGLIGLRVDLSAVMSCMNVDLSTAATFGGVADGLIEAADYGGSAIATQACPTPYGDQFFDLSGESRGGGSELDALYVSSDSLNLYVGITGNLEENGNRLQLWLDNGIGADGEHIITWDWIPGSDVPGCEADPLNACFPDCTQDCLGAANPGNGMEGDAMPPLPDTVTDALFDYVLSINVGGPVGSREVYADLWDIIARTSTFKGFTIMESGSGNLSTATGGSNQWGMQVALNNLNTAGVLGCQPFVDPCWFDDIATVETAASSVTSGFEIAIPLADIGIDPCAGAATIHLWAHVSSGDGWRSNQSLPSMRPEAGNLDSTEQIQNPGGVPVDWYQDFLILPEEFTRAVTITHVTTPGAIVSDCDSSGTEDVCDILGDPALDADFNGVIDSCELVTCTVVADCADTTGNGITDDVCTWWSCDAGVCVATPLVAPSDMGGAFGACSPDTFCNLADALHALTCFASSNACDSINIDAGGAFGGCAPDGFCNLADALHALTCFAGTNVCGCIPSPETQEPNVVGDATLTAVADSRAIKPGSEVQVSIFVNESLDNLLGYQLEAVVSGGRNGALELVNITIEDRYDAVYARAANPFEAFNVENSQVLAGNFAGAVETNASGYLATFTYRASDDALGTFVVDVLHSGANETMLVGAEQTDKIEIAGTTPAVVVVTSDRARSVR